MKEKKNKNLILTMQLQDLLAGKILKVKMEPCSLVKQLVKQHSEAELDSQYNSRCIFRK